MNYTYMKVFYTVATLQNISKAAKELNVSQPAVSRIISNIEEEYNLKLFSRSKSGVILTSEGLNLYEMIKFPIQELNKVERDIVSAVNIKEPIVHIGATSTVLYCFLFEKLEEFKKRFPTTKFRIYTNSSSNLLEMVKKGSIDFAFITTPFKISDEIEIYDIYTFKNILVAPMSYKEKINGRVSIQALKKFPFVFLNKEMQFREHVDKFLADNNLAINPAYETDNSATLLPFVENGCGLTFIPEEMAKQSINEGKCIEVDLIEEMPLRSISFIINKQKNHSNTVNEIKEKVIEKSRI